MKLHMNGRGKEKAMKPYYILIILAIVCAAVFSDKIGREAKANKKFRIALLVLFAILLIFTIVMIIGAII